MRTRFGWRPGIVEPTMQTGFSAFAQTPESDPVGDFFSDLWSNVASPAIQNKVQQVVQGELYGDPTGYITTTTGQRLPYWGTGASAWTIDSSGNQVGVPTTIAPRLTGGDINLAMGVTSSKLPGWVIPAAIGGGVLVLALVLMRR